GIGYQIKGTKESTHPLELQKALSRVKGESEEMVVSKLMLRSMKQAKYDPTSIGHFGLATDYYTHFTSPIRRYRDMMVKRLIRTYFLKSDMNSKVIKNRRGLLPETTQRSSSMERAAIDAEREVDDLKRAEYMKEKIGEPYPGIISSVTN